MNDIEEFNPKSFLARLLGMGDLEALMEKIRSATGEDKQKQIQKKMEEGKISHATLSFGLLEDSFVKCIHLNNVYKSRHGLTAG